MSKYRFIPITNCNAKIGVFGGSFNPPHAGHLHVSKMIKNAFGLDHIVWVPTKQNPLKSSKVASTFYDRIQACEELIPNKTFLVSDMESLMKSAFTIDLIMRIKHLHPCVKFYWIMGADCIKNFHKWRGWREILDLCEVIIYDRGNEIRKIRSTKLFAYLKQINVVQSMDPSSKVSYLKLRKHPLSSTYLRSKKNEF